jgi:hypothetical protein
MDRSLLVDKIAPRELLLRENNRIHFRIQGRTVFHGRDPFWEIAHEGSSLFSGCWRLLAADDRRILASYRYISASYRYGEDLRILWHESEEEFLFRRVDPEQDRWLLISRAGDVLLESAAAALSENSWELRVVGVLDDRILLPVVCLLMFDRLASDRL